MWRPHPRAGSGDRDRLQRPAQPPGHRHDQHPEADRAEPAVRQQQPLRRLGSPPTGTTPTDALSSGHALAPSHWGARTVGDNRPADREGHEPGRVADQYDGARRERASLVRRWSRRRTRPARSSSDVPRGELVALTCTPGSGRTTLLNLVGGLDEPDAGRITVDGLALEGLGEDGLLELRRDRIGFVFSSPSGSSRCSPSPRTSRRAAAAARVGEHAREERITPTVLVGLTDHAARRPGELTPGQQRRGDRARPRGRPRASLVLADEFAAGLDAATGRALMELLRTLSSTANGDGAGRPLPGDPARPGRSGPGALRRRDRRALSRVRGRAGPGPAHPGGVERRIRVA